MSLDMGLTPRFYINGIQSGIGASNYGFTMTDSIHEAFPDIEFLISDNTGLAIELGTFTRGIPLKIVMELDGNILESQFIVSHRDVIQPLMSSVMGGNIKVSGVHESYTKGREKVSAYYNKKASDIVKELFPDIEAENTSAKLAIYQHHEPYAFIKNVLMDISDSSTKTPFVFFRDLTGKLIFKSIGELFDQSPIVKLSLMQTDGTETIANTMNMFLPFDEKLTETLHALAVRGQWLDGLDFKKEDVTLIDSVSQYLPVIADTIKDHTYYFGRQFNPDIDYGAVNAALWTGRMRKGFLTDKAFAVIPFNYQMVSGKVIETEVFLQDENQEPSISEVYSGKWLIEKAIHTWDGPATTALTKLVLSRNSLKPVSNSILETDSYKGK